MGCCTGCFRVSTYILVLIAVLLFLHLQCVREKQEQLENKFTKPYRPDDTVVENHPLPFCKQGSTMVTNFGIEFLLVQSMPCCLVKLMSFLIGQYKPLYHLLAMDMHNITFHDARKQNPGTFNDTGFTLITLDEEATTTDWRTSYFLNENADVTKFHKQMEPYIRKLYPAVNRFKWMSNVVRGGDKFLDQPAAIDGPHLDFHLNHTARALFHKNFKAVKGGKVLMEGSIGDEKLGVMLGIWKPIIPEKRVCDHPLAMMDASTFSQEHDNPHHLHFELPIIGSYSTFGSALHNLMGAISYDPKQRWYYYPFQSTKEVLVFHQYSHKRFWANPHTSFLNRNCPPDTEKRVSAELRVVLYF